MHSLARRSTCLLRLSYFSLLPSVSIATTTLSDDYQFIQRSKIPTMYFQQSLPRLPIPKLEKTCYRFLAAIEPLVSDQEFAEAKRAVLNFQNDDGKKMQELLKAFDSTNKHTSYISELWFNMYLSDRSPLPINYNPLIVMKNDIRPEYQVQLIRATNLIISSLRFWRSLQTNALEPEVFHLHPQKTNTEEFRKWVHLAPTSIATYVAYVFKAYPLDMSQYSRLFGASRIPELHKDRLIEYPDSRHILVLIRGNMYSVDVLDNFNRIEPPHVIKNRLEAVIKLDEKRDAAKVPLGILTTGNRDDWARVRHHITHEISNGNKELMSQEVDAALFCLCLDSKEDPTYNEEDPTPFLKHFLAGHGKNRWFDKSVSLLISADGAAALNFEHSWGDGVAVLRYFNEIYKDTLENPFICDSSSPIPITAADRSIRVLNWDIDSMLKREVDTAERKHLETVHQLDMNMLRYQHLNKNICKQFGISPDSVMQLSFQLAYKLAFNSYVATYESCSTAAFRHGRTETIRPCTVATKQFCETAISSKNEKSSSKMLLGLMKQCSTIHSQLTKEAAMGQGFDRHLFALKDIASMNGMTIPELYLTNAYKQINYNIISTSTLSSDALLAGCFGPVVGNGLGIGYSIQNSECGAIITSYKNQRDGKYFTECLEEAFNMIKNILIEA